MSTVDPVALRKLRTAKRPGPVPIAIALVLQFAGGLAAGYGWPQMMLFDDADPPALAMAGIISSIPLLVIGSLLWTGIVLKHRRLGLSMGGAIAWLGAALGVQQGSSNLGNPPWMAALAAGFLAVAMLLALFGALAARRRRITAIREEEIMLTGTAAAAIVSDKGYTIFRESSKIFTTVTFTFHDLAGIQRWVQRSMLINAAAPVVDGAETTLWYDAMDPGNDKKIVVKLARDSPLR